MSSGKLVVFFGSPRQDGYTAKLLREVERGAREAGLEIVEHDLCADGVLGCQGCFFCRTHDSCATQDALQSMYADLRDATGLAIGIPIYFYRMGGQVKQWLDRMFPMVEMDGDNPKPRHPGKKFIAVYAQGNPEPDAYASEMDFLAKVQTEGFGWSETERLICAGSPEPGSPAFQHLMKRAYDAGRAMGE